MEPSIRSSIIIPVHLRESLINLLNVSSLPTHLRSQISSSLSSASQIERSESYTKSQTSSSSSSASSASSISPQSPFIVPIVTVIPKEDDKSQEHQHDHEINSELTSPPSPPLTIDSEVIDAIARWAGTEQGKGALIASNLDPGHYQIVSLLAGTEVYLGPKQRNLLLASSPTVSPYLPSYLSPAPPTIGSEYRTVARQLTTFLNIAFSIVGSAFAVYVVSTTGAGYTPETGVLLGVLAGVVVGIADGVLVWIFSDRLGKDRKASREMARKVMSGSGGEGIVIIRDEDGKITHESEEGSREEMKKREETIKGGSKLGQDRIEGSSSVEKRSIRLRRRAIGSR